MAPVMLPRADASSQRYNGGGEHSHDGDLQSPAGQHAHHTHHHGHHHHSDACRH